MKIALYYPWIYLKSGIERTILETVKRSKHQYTIYTSHYDPNGTFPEFKKLKVIELKKIPVRRNIFSVIKASITIALQKIDLNNFQLFMVHSEGIGDLILIRNHKIPAVCFCHTPLRPVFDPEYKKRAKAKRSPARRVLYSIFDILFRNTDILLWKRYKYIFFNSKESLRRAKHGRLVSKQTKYITLHPGVDWENIKPGKKFEKYFLVPGRIMWTKNIELAIDSFKLFNSKIGDYKLIIAGMVDKKSKKYSKSLRKMSPINKNIIFITNPSDKKMASLYSNCFTALSTAFNEDWGITTIEANAYGKPVIAVNMGGLRKVK